MLASGTAIIHTRRTFVTTSQILFTRFVARQARTNLQTQAQLRVREIYLEPTEPHTTGHEW
jgi:hypothetical protein